MAEYYIEIPSSPSVDRFGGRCRTFDKRFADADDFPQPVSGAVRVGYQLGASLGVAFVVLLSGQLGGVALSRLGFIGEVALSIAAIVGALSVMGLIVLASRKVAGSVTLLIIGVMIGYIANAVIGVLKFFSVEEDIKAYVIWGLGSLPGFRVTR